MYSSVPSPPASALPFTSPLDRAAASPTSPTSPTSRTGGRLRGLSYLRTYTQNHILSRDHNSSSSGGGNGQQRPSTLARATSYPSPSSPGRGGSTGAASPLRSPLSPSNTRQPSPTAQRATYDLLSARSSDPENLTATSTSTSGWLPTVGGQSAVSRTPSQPQSSTAPSSSAVLSANGTGPKSTAITMGRTRSATVGDATGRDGDANPQNEASASQAVANANGERNGMAHQLPSIRFTAHQDPRAQRPSLVFPPMARILPTGKEVIKVGRYSERDNQPPQAANVPSSTPVGFKSKVVSRRHCEFWCSNGRWFIKDVKSSSGTFLNHVRLSSPGTESRPFPINDGDIVQLGIDFKGGEEMIFRCVKIRVELNKGWQNGPSNFNVQSHKRLRELNNTAKLPASGSSQDCSICLGPIAPCQSLFVAPCSHTWHYKCIRVIINGHHWPHFICPNCRSVADLEAELDDSGEWEELAETDGAVQPPAAAEPEPAQQAVPVEPEQTNGQHNTSEVQPVRGPEVAVQNQNGSNDLDFGEASDDSGTNQRIQQTAAQLGHLNLDADESRSTFSAGDPPANELSNSTVPPVDIINTKAILNLPAASSSRVDRKSNRTPSPKGQSSSLSEAITGPEGPMTPRNDAGPFIFDGSAGRASSDGPVPPPSMNLNAKADTPLQPIPDV